MRTRTTSSNPRSTTRRTGRQPARRGAGGAVSREQRVRDSGGPQDTAFYRCACGYGFEGDVSTHVACPHCGSDQDW
jgi:hypothetical protein